MIIRFHSSKEKSKKKWTANDVQRHRFLFVVLIGANSCACCLHAVNIDIVCLVTVARLIDSGQYADDNAARQQRAMHESGRSGAIAADQ